MATATTKRVPPFSSALNRAVVLLERAVFTNDADPIVVALKGGWGEGKTYFWRNSVAADRGDNEPGYVSVFGAESLTAIQREVVVEALRTRPNKNVAAKAVKKTIEKSYPFLTATKGILNAIGSNFGFTTDALAVPPEILQRIVLRPGWTVCLDDIERLPQNIEFDALFGYVSTLRDEYRVNVVLIYNQDKVQDQTSLMRYAEKVVDRDIPFVPLASDIAKLAIGELTDDAEALADLGKKCDALQLRNIRILRRVRRYYQEVVAALPKPADAAYLRQALNAILISSWIRFSSIDAKDLTLEFLELFDGSWRFFEEEDKNEKRTDWREALLKTYGYLYTDDLDKILIGFVRTDLLDEEKLRGHYEAYLERRRYELAQERLRNIYQKYFHGTLRDTEPDFSNALIKAVKEDMKYLSLGSIDAVLMRLEASGNSGAAEVILEQLKQHFPEKLQHFDERPKYRGLLKIALEAKKRAEVDTRPLGEVIESAVSERFVRQHDRERLSQFSATDVVEYFNSVERDHLTGYLREIATSTARPGGDEFDRKVNELMLEAAGRIAASSPQNHQRMEAMGLIGPDAPRAPPDLSTPPSSAA